MSSNTEMVFALFFGMFIGAFICACVAVNITTDADKEITKCEMTIPRNINCKIIAVPMDSK